MLKEFRLKVKALKDVSTHIKDYLYMFFPAETLNRILNKYNNYNFDSNAKIPADIHDLLIVGDSRVVRIPFLQIQFFLAYSESYSCS